jgi:dipeptidyl aminopeptidase/acylaminoacyl peptidase
MPRPLAPLVLASTLLAAGAIAEPLSVKDLFAIKWVSQLTASPDGKHVAFVVQQADYAKNKRQTNIWIVRLAPGARPRQLTNSPGMNRAPAFSPDGKQLAFVSSRGGDEPQLWLIPVDGGEAVQLTQLATGAADPLWSPDGKLLAFTSEVYPGCKNFALHRGASEGREQGEIACTAKKAAAEKSSKVKARVYDQLLFRHWNEWRGERRTHILVVPVAGGQPRDLTPGPHDAPPIALGGRRDCSFSRDGKTLAYASNTDAVVATSTNNDVFEVPTAGGAARRVSLGKGNDYNPRYSPDGRYLAYLSMARPGYEADRPRIVVRDLRSGKESEWTRTYAGHVLDFVWAPDSKAIYFLAPHEGRQEIFVATTQNVRQLSKGLYAKDLDVTPDGGTLVFADEAAHRPPEVCALGRDGKRQRALTSFNSWLTRRAGLQRAEHVWFAGDGGARLHAVLLKPPGFVAGKRYPAIMIIHGGPQGMTGDDFHPRWNLQMLAAAGAVVFGVNFHGSLGFGQPFTDAITGDWGGKPYRDVLRGADHLASLPYIDGKKICAVGASYGGYLVNWIATQTQRFSCLISHAGLYNLESKYGSTEELWFPEHQVPGTPWTNRAAYRRWSPSSYAEKLRTPTLVIHGQNDYRVPVEQALQMFTALQRQGVPSRLLYFPDEDHFVQKPQNVELWWKTMHDWLRRYLKGS